MSINESKIVDFVGFDNNGNIVLTISDHLNWEAERNHLFLLQEKLNAYCQFIESGELCEKYPAAKGKQVVIEVVGFHDPTATALRYFDVARTAVEKEGYTLKYKKYSGGEAIDAK